MNILVTGGAGYIGSHVVELLLREGYDVVVVDNLSQGHRAAVGAGAQLVEVDICAPDGVESTFRKFRFDAVMHLAGESIVQASTRDPGKSFYTNVAGGLNLLEKMARHGVSKMIFSSTASVYGEPKAALIPEDHPTEPVNPYGESKLMFERILCWYARAHGLRYISLRYFNAAGASAALGEDHRPETHLIPIVLKSALSGEPVPVFGTDYPTRDGTCIRDYIHVTDIARAHLAALERLETQTSGVYNLGNGDGFSVREVVNVAGNVTGRDIPMEVRPRRPGDPAVLVADASRARVELGWQPEIPGLEAIIASAWEWSRRHPRGYE